MSNETIYITALATRVIFLLLFTGSYFWFILAFNSAAKLLPPPQRLELQRAVQRRFIILSWIFFAGMTVTGVATLYVSPTPILIDRLSPQQSLVLALEGTVTVLILITTALIHFIFLRRARRTSISAIESEDRSLKWFTTTGGKSGLSALSNIFLLSIINCALGTVAIILGMIFSIL